MKWPTRKEHHKYMRARQSQNMSRALTNANENWMRDILEKTGHKWTRQAQWGFRLFDFWNHSLGIAVEVDGLEHNKSYDSSRDEYNYQTSGIVVLRVGNLNRDDADKAVAYITSSCTWNERRSELGLPFIRT